MDFWYGLLKVISMIATGIFGALALLTKYKNNDDKVTVWGKIALGGILISVSISLGLYVLENAKAKEEAVKAQSMAEKAQADAEQTSQLLNGIFDRARTAADKQELGLEKTNKLQSDVAENLKKQEQGLDLTDKIAKDMNASAFAQRILLTDNKKIMTGINEGLIKQANLLTQSQEVYLGVNRSLSSIENFQVSFTFNVPLSHPDLANYTAYLDTQIKHLLPKLREAEKDSGIIEFEGLSLYDESDLTFMVNSSSPYFPSRNTPEGKLLNNVFFSVDFYKPPFDVTKITEIEALPDFSMGIMVSPGDLKNNPDQQFFFILHDLKSKKDGYILQRGMTVDTDNIIQSGKIPSLLDFGGTLMVVRFVSGLDKRMKLTGDLILHQPKGKCFVIDAKLFQRIQEGIRFNDQAETLLFQVLPSDLKITTECLQVLDQ